MANELSLQDLQSVSPETFVPKEWMPELDTVNPNDKSASQIAATETMIQGKQSVQDYQQIKQDLLSQDSRQQYLLQTQARRNAIMSDLKNSASTVLLSPNVPDQQKKDYVSTLQNPDLKYQPSTVRQLFEQATVSSHPNETERAHEAKLNLMDIAGQVETQKRQAMAAINQLHLKSNGVDLAKDIGELMVPFAEWIHVNSLLGQATDKNHINLLGQEKQKLFKLSESIPVSKRAEYTKKIIDLIKNNPNVILPDGNDLESLDILNNMLVSNDYSNFGRWMDNITSLADILGLGSLIKGVGKAARGAKVASEAADVAAEGRATTTFTDSAGNVKQAEVYGPNESSPGDNATYHSTHTDVAPTSPSQVVKDGNAEAAQELHKRAAEDNTGDSAKALYGTNKTEAMAKDSLPEPTPKEGEIPNKVEMDNGPQHPEDSTVHTIRTTDGQTYLSEGEIKAMQGKIIDGLNNIIGMVPQKSSMGIHLLEDGSTLFQMMYRPVAAGFRSATEALNNAAFAFRAYGLKPEDFTLYARQGDKWVETTPKELDARKAARDVFVKNKKKIPDKLKNIDYAVGINYKWKFSAGDEASLDALSVKRNFIDRLPPWFAKAGGGSITQHLLDTASVLHPQIVEPAMVAVDRGTALKKAYINTFDKFTKLYKKLPKDRRALMTDYIHTANFEGIRFDPVDLRARGFTTKEIDALRQWRIANDTMWYGANADMVKTLKARGFKVFVDNTNDTTLVVKPIERGGVNSTTHVYNPALDKIMTLSKEELDTLYEKGGSIAKLSEPMNIDGTWIDKIHLPIETSQQYVRALREDEKVLRYRDGYYPKMYDANYYIKKKVTLADGTEESKTIASAKHKADADHLLAELQREHPDATFERVTDRRVEHQKGSTIDQNGWDIGVSSGLSMQKIRGKPLMDAGVDLEKAGSSNLIDPLEAVNKQIHQLSQRVSTRDYIETTKQRWLQNYGDKLDLPQKFGRDQYPTDLMQIKAKPGTSSKTLADARSLYNYIDFLEYGVANSIDDGFKALMNWFAQEAAGNSDLSKMIESFGHGVAKQKLTTTAKGAVFKLYLAANPARQLIIQGIQNVQLYALDPIYMTGPVQWDMYRLSRVRFGATDDAEAVAMYKELQHSGMLDAVDSNNLVRQEMKNLADVTALQKFRHVVGAPLRWSQRLGFDTAEQSVLLMSWLTHRNIALKEGLTLNRRVLDEISGKARAFTYGMNRAGDMPYNNNALNVAFQFLQVPHKAFLQPLTNRSLTRMQRARLFAFNVMMYGVPAYVGTALVDNAIDPSEPVSTDIKDKLSQGMLDYLLNKSLTEMSGTKQEVNFAGSLSPYNTTGMMNLLGAIATTDVGQIVTNAPATSLVMGNNPRLTEAFRTVSRYFNAPWDPDYKDPKLKTKLSDVVMASAYIFSGFSNAFKARYAFKTGKAMSSLGNVTDADVTKVEAVFKTLGFETKTEAGRRKVQETLYSGESYTPTDVKLWYNELKRQLARRGVSAEDARLSQNILREGWRVFEDSPYKAREQLFNLIKKDVSSGNTQIFDDIMKKMGIMKPEEVRNMITEMPPSKLRSRMLEQINNFEKAQNNG